MLNKGYRILIFLSCFSGVLIGQEGNRNLISNGSFEKFYKKDQRAFCNSWEFMNSVDYFSTEYIIQDVWSKKATAPENFEGYQNAQDGNAYIGLVYIYYTYKFREFISTKLDTFMEKGAKYHLEFYISLSDSSKYFSNSIIFWFSEDIKPVFYKNRLILDTDTPIILNNLNINKQDWTKVSYIYTAHGREKYFTIGNCLSCTTKKQYRKTIIDRRKAKKSNRPDNFIVYYFIDNVSLRKQ